MRRYSAVNKGLCCVKGYHSVQALYGEDLELKYGAAAAHNRAMADFCGVDSRLSGVGILPLDDPALAAAELDQLLDLDLKAAWVAHDHCGGRSPGHNDFDPIWARLGEAGVPVVLHVGGVPIQVADAWMNTGRPVPQDWLGGGENVRGKDMLAMHHGAEMFFGAMMDRMEMAAGFLQTFPNLPERILA